MPAINYTPFLIWAAKNLHSLKRAGDRVAQLERDETIEGRWNLKRQIGCELAPSLEALTYSQVEEYPATEIEAAEDKILAAVNAPIETAAVVNREVRDRNWLRRLHIAANAILEFIDAPTVSIATDAGGPAPSQGS